MRLSEGLMHQNEKRHLYSDKAFSVSLHGYPPRRGRIPPQPDRTFPTRIFLHPPNADTMAVPSLPLGCPTGCVNVPCRLRNTTSSPARCHCITSYCALASQGSFFSLPFQATNTTPPLPNQRRPSAESDAAPHPPTWHRWKRSTLQLDELLHNIRDKDLFHESGFVSRYYPSFFQALPHKY